MSAAPSLRTVTQRLLEQGARPAVANKARHIALVAEAHREAGDCRACDGTGEGPADSACSECRGRGHFGSAK